MMKISAENVNFIGVFYVLAYYYAYWTLRTELSFG